MNVKAILAAKRRRHYQHRADRESRGGGKTAWPSTGSARCVILGAGGRLAGILSERDIVRALAERGAEALDAAGRAGDDPQGRDLRRGRHGRQHHGADDRREIPPHAGGRRRRSWSASSRSATWSSSASRKSSRKSEAMRDYIRTA